MAPFTPLTVHPSCVQVASIAENELAPVLATRNTPAIDSTRAAPSTLASADPVVVTCTLELANCPASVGSSDVPPPPPPPGDVGDPSPLHAVASVASVAQEATWQAPAQNSRRERSWFDADIVILEWGREASGQGRQDRGHAEITRFCKREGVSSHVADYRLGR